MPRGKSMRQNNNKGAAGLKPWMLASVMAVILVGCGSSSRGTQNNGGGDGDGGGGGGGGGGNNNDRGSGGGAGGAGGTEPKKVFVVKLVILVHELS